MDCRIIETMKWYDWASASLLMFLGMWKLVDLCRSASAWAEKKCEAQRKARYEAFWKDINKK